MDRIVVKAYEEETMPFNSYDQLKSLWNDAALEAKGVIFRFRPRLPLLSRVSLTSDHHTLLRLNYNPGILASFSILNYLLVAWLLSFYPG